MGKIEILSSNEQQTMDLGEFFGIHGMKDLFIALTGDLGAGKTHFVQGLAKGMGIDGIVQSPTFTILNYYDSPLPLKHFDFYRLSDEEELYEIGWDEYSAGGVTVVEWAEKFPSLIPDEAIRVEIAVTDMTHRTITISWNDKAPAAFVKEITAYAACH